MTRRGVLLILIAVLATGLYFDVKVSKPISPFLAPPAIALGSGVGSAGALCTAGQ